MKTTFTPELKRKRRTDKEGYINVRMTKDRKSRYFSIGIKLHEDLWNEKNNTIDTMLRVNRRSMTEDQRENIINKYTEKETELKSLFREQENVEIIPKNDLSFLYHLEKFIKQLEERKQIGTSKRYRTTLYHVQKFLKKQGKTNLLFSEITPSLITDFETHLIGLSIKGNTTKNYINSIKRIYTKSLGEGLFTTTLNPFVNFVNKRVDVKKDFLEKKHVQDIFMSKFEKDDPLYNTRNFFLFQIFGQGLRVSDLLTLRFENIREGLILFDQFKTKDENTIHFTPTTLWILKDYIKHPDIEKIINRRYIYPFKGVKYTKNYEDIKTHYSEVSKLFLSSNFGKMVENKPLDPTCPYTLQDVENLKSMMDKTLTKITDQILIFISDYSKTHKKDFIFPIIKNKELFKDVVFNEDTKLTKKQYNHLQTQTTLYNRSLKKLQKEVNIQSEKRGEKTSVYSPIEIPLTSHLPRHTYTNLMLEIGGDVYEISKSIGHQNIQTTNKYVRTLQNRIRERNKDLGKEYSQFI